MNEDDDKDLRNEWHPSDEEFASFQERDLEHAQSNLEVLLGNYSRPVSMREIKDGMLHNPTTVAVALEMELDAGRIVEIPGKVPTYALS